MEWDVAISIRVNLLTGGKAEEPLCSRVWHNALFSPAWEVVRFCLDTLFAYKEPEHCYRCHLRFLRRGRPKSGSLSRFGVRH